MSYVTFAWIASIAFGFETLLAKIGNKHTIPNPWLFNFLWRLLVLVYLIPIASINNASMPLQWNIIVLTAIVHAGASICYVQALSKLDVSVFSPLFNFKTIFSIILGYIFLHEVLTVYQLILVGVLIMAGFTVAMDEKLQLRSFFRPGVLILLLATLLFSVFSVLLNRAIAQNGYWTANLWIGIVNVLVTTLTFPFFNAISSNSKGNSSRPFWSFFLPEPSATLRLPKHMRKMSGSHRLLSPSPFQCS